MNKKKISSIDLAMAVLILAASFQACQSEPEIVQVKNSGPTQGTSYHISYVAERGVDYRASIDSILFVIDESMSLWVENSTISKLNRGDTVALDKHILKVVDKSLEVCEKTKGAFDITIAPLVDYWGFGPSAKTTPDSLTVDSLRQLIGYKKLENILAYNALPRHMKIDVNAIAQGYSADVISAFLGSRGLENYLVEIGGELRAKGKNIDGNIWTIGIDKPKAGMREEGQFQAIVKLDNKGLATSGNYRKFWVDEETGMKYVHTIDPKTGYPVKSNVLSASILADDAATADAWATACMVVGVDEAKKLIVKEELDAYLVYSDKNGNLEIWQTAGFKEAAY